MPDDEPPQPIEESAPIQEEQLTQDIGELDALRAEIASLRQQLGEHTHDGYATTEHDHAGAVPPESTPEEDTPVEGETEDITDQSYVNPRRHHIWFRKLGA